MKNINVVIVDDHQLFRDGLSGMLSKYDFINTQATLEDGHKLMNYLTENKSPDIVLLDLSMPNMDGFDVLKCLSKDYQTIKAIAISMYDDGNYIARCAQYGAYGYLLKNTDEKELLLAIEQVFNGKKYYNTDLFQKMIASMSDNNFIKKLTNKEEEILQLLSQGLTTKEIASKLFISGRTVETHRSNMLKKLDVKNTVELINKAVELGLM